MRGAAFLLPPGRAVPDVARSLDILATNLPLCDRLVAAEPMRSRSSLLLPLLVLAAGMATPAAAQAPTLAAASSVCSPLPADGRSTGSDATLIIDVAGGTAGHCVVARTAEGLIVGQGAIQDGRAVLIVRGDDPVSADRVEGAREGEAIQIEVAPTQEATQARTALDVEQIAEVTRGQVEGALQFRANAVWKADAKTIAETFFLDENYPNPFNPRTTIRYRVPEQGPVRVAVYDMLGKRVTTLVERLHEEGTHEVTFDGTGLASGLYVYRLEAAGHVSSRTMMLLK